MKKSTETLYWVDYKQFIHYNEKTDVYSFDKEMPEKAIESFKLWLKKNFS